MGYLSCRDIIVLSVKEVVILPKTALIKRPQILKFACDVVVLVTTCQTVPMPMILKISRYFLTEFLTTYR